MSIEIMLLATNTLFITFANMYSDLVGQIIVFFILTVAACEAAVGLALIVILFRNTGSIELQTLRNNHG
jgi:NADH-quinone oxidoreductase subunit K